MGLPNTYNNNFTNNVINTLKNTYHINIYINGNLLTDRTTQNFFNSSGYDRIEYRLDSGYIFEGNVYSRYSYDGVVYYPLMTKTSDSIAYFDLSIYDSVPFGNYSNYLSCYYGNFSLNGISTPYFTIADSSANVFTLTKTLSNCAINPNISTMTEDENISFSINANTGYRFDSVPTLIDSQNVSIALTKVSDTQYSASFIAYDDLTLSASAVAIPQFTLTKTLSNCAINPNISTMTEDENISFSINANTGYRFDSVPTLIDSQNVSIALTKVSDTQYSASFIAYDDLTLTASAVTIPQTTTLTKNLTNCTINPNIDNLVLGNTYNITINANSGYVFDVAPSASYRNAENTLIHIPITKVNDYEYTLTMSYSRVNNTSYTITAYASVESQTSTKYGVLSLYKIDNDILKSINDLKYYTGGSSLSQIDFSKYIASLKIIFFDVATTLTDNILISDINTQITAPKIENDYAVFSLGEITLTGYYNNGLDKLYSEIYINLPYVNQLKIDSVYINEIIKIEYRVHLISGLCTVFIYNKRDNVYYLINTIDGNMSYDLPYTLTVDSSIKPIQTQIKPLNFDVAPSITIKTQLKADVNDDVYTCHKIAQIKNEIGYFKIDRILNDNANIPSDLLNLIEFKLKSGVIY